MSAQATLSFDGSDLAEIRSPPELLARLEGEGQPGDCRKPAAFARCSARCARRCEVALVRQGAKTTEESIKALAEKLVERASSEFDRDTGLLRSTGSNFTLEAELASGQVLVNGQPAMQLFGGMTSPPLPMGAAEAAIAPGARGRRSDAGASQAGARDAAASSLTFAIGSSSVVGQRYPEHATSGWRASDRLRLRSFQPACRVHRGASAVQGRLVQEPNT